ncbi:MAG: thioesterase family protein [Anaeromyxobacteraceae bacterium]
MEIRIPFHHVDYLRVVWHGRYIEYLEAAQGAYLRRQRLDLADMQALGYLFMVAETNVRHVAPLRYGDLLRVGCWVTGDEGRIDMAYDLSLVSTGERCAVARTSIVTLTVAGELCLATPEEVLERLRAAVGPDGSGR